VIWAKPKASCSKIFSGVPASTTAPGMGYGFASSSRSMAIRNEGSSGPAAHDRITDETVSAEPAEARIWLKRRRFMDGSRLEMPAQYEIAEEGLEAIFRRSMAISKTCELPHSAASLTEHLNVLTYEPIRPVANDLDRRWISDDYFDLIVWYEPDRQIHGFQLCYDKLRRERALTWTHQRGFRHSAVDTGEHTPTTNQTPILVAGGAFPVERVKAEFIARSSLLPIELRELVLLRIDHYKASLPHIDAAD
jgi:hypothetical protein